jgi:hypothetical protein
MRPSPGSRNAQVRAFVVSTSPDRRGDLLPLRGATIPDHAGGVKIKMRIFVYSKIYLDRPLSTGYGRGTAESADAALKRKRR